MDIKLLLLIVVLIVITAVVIYFLSKTYLKKKDEKYESRKISEQVQIDFDAELRHEYSAALLSGDKEKALALGRKYYRSIRGGEPTENDEQAISNDLLLMKKV